jgi:class 3 adenylate cyclase
MVLAASLSDPAGGREGAAPSLDLRAWIERLVQEHGGSPSWGERGQLVVLWSGAKARESAPERATRAALALRDGMRGLREKDRHTQTLRIGIGTGSLFRGADAAPGEGSMEGAAMRWAAALEAKAPADGILLSESTYRYIRGVFDVVPQEPKAVEGGGRTEGVYLLDRAKPRPFRMPIRGVGSIETRTIGREKDLAALQ